VKAIFIHIPRTGGTSLRTALGGRVGRVVWSHGSALAIKPIVGDWEDRFKFSFVRNPWERVASWYVYFKSLSILPLKPFKYYVLSDNFFMENKHSPEFVYIDPFTQKHYLATPSGEILVDFIGRFENIEEDFIRLCESLDFTPPTLPKLNSVGGDYRKMYTDEMVERVAQRCKWDIDTFGYKWEG